MNHILVGIDGSKASEVAARYALDFAAIGNSDIRAVGVVPVNAFTGGEDDLDKLAFSQDTLAGEHMATRAVTEWFDEAEKLCTNAEVCFLRSMDQGDPAKRLPHMGMTAGLTVLGARGADEGKRGGHLGRVSTAMLGSAIKPMMITKGEHRPIKHVLVGWDGRAEAAHALEMVYALASAGDWKITLVAGGAPNSFTAQTCWYVSEHLKREGANIETHVIRGDAPNVVLDAARSFEANLIAIGSRPKGAAGALFRGAAWREIAELSPVPVLLYR